MVTFAGDHLKRQALSKRLSGRNSSVLLIFDLLFARFNAVLSAVLYKIQSFFLIHDKIKKSPL